VANVLGVSAHYHDAAAALLVDGTLVSALQEERLSRVKNDPSLPVRAIAACLARAGLTGADLDAVIFYENPYAKLDRILNHSLRVFPRAIRQFPRAVGSQLGEKLWVLDQLSELTGVSRKRVEFVNHHESHAASAFFPSPFASAAVVIADAVGEDATTSIWHGAGERLAPLETTGFPHSLGLFYAAITAYLGFRVNEGEFKVMGLAAFGKPRFRAEFSKFITIAQDGSAALRLPFFAHMTDLERGFGKTLETLLGPRRQRGPWDFARATDQRYADIAATAQAVLEDALLATAGRAQHLTGETTLCLAGGVALNASANARILRETAFTDVFVQPAAGDAGGALGAAILGALARGDGRGQPMEHAAHGVAADASRARDVATHLGFAVQRLGDPSQWIAERIARNQVVGVVNGRSEWGPRALGHRSLLASPAHVDMRERLNRIIKEREPFRPFAPSVTADRASVLFDDSDNHMTAFMTTTCPVRDSHQARLGAVTHVDGSARVQTVHATRSPYFHAVLRAAEQLGLPCILNTSLNGPGQPICASATDAVAFFASHTVDALVIEDVAITRGRG